MSPKSDLRALPRTSVVFGAIDLFDTLAGKHGLDLTIEGDVARFGAIVSAALEEGRASPHVLHGRRVQAMFAYVAASLGRVDAIKEEDSGRVIVGLTVTQTPDYRVLLRDGDEFFVEVKNCNSGGPSSKLLLRRADHDALLNYGRVFKRPVRLAVYWSRWNMWTLVSLERVTARGTKVGISLLDAMKYNEMSHLGDVLIGTKPPLIMRFVTDPTKPRSIDSQGHTEFTIAAVEMYCGGREILEGIEKNYAFYLMRYGRWIEESIPRVEDGNLVALDFVFNPVEDSDQGFEMVGWLSGMIARQYNELTAHEAAIRRLTPRSAPGSLGLLIDSHYKGDSLPLWRFSMIANDEQLDPEEVGSGRPE